MSDSPQSVDELRQRLRELGYLDAGVDRFVLAPVGRGRRAVAVAGRISLRIGLLAALLLGPSTAVGLATRVPGLVVGPRDGLVLGLYLGAVFLVAMTAVAMVTIAAVRLVVSRVAGATVLGARAAVLARVAGLVVGLGTLAYLVLWWRGIGQDGSAWGQPVWTVAALVGMAGLSVLLGHSVAVAARVMLAQDADLPSPILRRRARSRLATVLVWALAFAGAVGLLQMSSGGRRDQTPAVAPRLDVRSGRVSILVLGIDGFDLAFGERLAASGRTPALAALLGGAKGVVDLDADADPAAVWTSIATGQPVAVHGVRGIEARRVSGLAGEMAASGGGLVSVLAAATDRLRLTRPAAASGLQRRAKTFWEVAGEQGLKAGVVNWWATWPAPGAAGIVVSDRATLRLDRGGALDGEIAPAALYEELRSVWPSVRQAARREATAAFSDVGEPVGDALRRAAEQDVIQLAVARRAAPRASDLLAVYLPGLDIAQYSIVSGPSAAGLPASALAARVDALERYYTFLDSQLGTFLAGSGAWRLRALITEPGRSRSRGPGVVALTGELARTGSRVAVGRPDVAPTLLHLLGLPVSRELGGRVLEPLLLDSFVAATPVRHVETYGRRLLPRPQPGTEPLDEDALERLRSLGYIR